MDYLDKRKALIDKTLLWLGYFFIALGIVIATLVLVYQAYGFGVNNKGAVIQNGLVFFSSQPNPASIYLNGKLRAEQTNSRIILPAGVYKVKISKTSYGDWTRTIILNGGTVAHYDYPFLIPISLKPQRIQSYTASPGLMTQSPDHRWLLIEKPGSITDFDLYDLKDPTKPLLTPLSVPANILTKASSSESLSVVDWADDNLHILMQHNYDNKTEYILIDRSDSSKSVNINNSLAINPINLTLANKKFDQYFVLDANHQLKNYNLNGSVGNIVINRVLAYKTYGSNTILYATDAGALPNKVVIRLESSGNSYIIRSLAANSNYLLNLTTYNGTLYVAAGSSLDNRVYIYQDPVGQINNYPNTPPISLWVLHVTEPNYLSFSANAQFIFAENGTNFSVYDIENKQGFTYKDPLKPIDQPQLHVSWMDGDRIVYVSQGMQSVQDYDNNNFRTLIPASANYIPAFSADYKYMYNLNGISTGQYELNQTPLTLP